MSHWLNKFWVGDRVYEESVCFIEDGLDELLYGSLLFTPTKILQVKSSDGNTIYEEGIDYVLHNHGIHRTANSNIPVLLKDSYYAPYEQDQNTNWLRTVEGTHYIRIFPPLRQYQVLVTYEHHDTWKGLHPQNQNNLLPLSTSLLKNQQPMNIVFYGDSITAGWEASGCDEHVIDMYSLKEFHLKTEYSPYMPAWTTLVTNALTSHYDNQHIHKVNRGAGGSSSAWGATHADTFVNPYHPDLVALAFGMNNLNDDPEKYFDEITDMIHTIRSKNPKCEFLLVSPMEANREIGWLSNHKLLLHEKALVHIQEKYEGIAVAPVHSMFLGILSTGKKYMDISGNCINHPNDFSIRVYAQTILSCLGL